MVRRWTCAVTQLLLVVLFLCAAVNTASAQAVYGSVFGTVTDPQGAAVANAKVTVTNVRKGTTDTTTTNQQGNYSVTHLVPDTYDVTIEAPGFKTASSKGIVVNADAASRVDLGLALGSTSESVEVTAEAPQLKTDRADVATTFNERYVTELPILNRNFTQFELLSPGTQKLVGWSHASTENPQGSQQIFVNGQHFSGTAFELDGTDNQDPILGIIVVNPNIDAITETKIALQNYDAEFGKAVAGVVTVQTKSGSNDLHGTGFWFRRTDATSARNPFNQFKADDITGRFIPEDRWNQFGGTFGGPIIKNKLFFFGDYQGTRQASGNTAQLTIPIPEVISSCGGNGDGSGFCKLNQYAGLIGGANVPIGDPRTLIYDPATGNPDGSGRTAFCGPAGCATQPNWIPFARIPESMRKLIALYPSPTNGNLQQNLIASGSGPFSANQWDTRVDWTTSNTMNVFGRFSMARFNIAGTGLLGELVGRGNGIGGLAGSSVTHNYSLASGFTKTISSTLLTDFRFGWFKYNPTTHKQREGDTPAADIGIPNVNFGDRFTSGWPSFQFPGGSIMGGEGVGSFGEGLSPSRCNCPLVQSEQQFQWVNNWTKMSGNHAIKFGGDVRYAMNLRVPSDANRAGVFNFDRRTTSNAGTGGFELASLLLGEVQSFNRFVSSSTNAAERQKRLFFYGQDTWRATQKLTLSFGLRWEVYTPETVNGRANGGFANLERGEIRVAGVGGIGLNGDVENKWNALAPRLGIAYQVAPKTVVRMGYGRSYDIGVFGSNFGHAVTQNLPVLVNQTSNGPNDFTPAFNIAAGPPLPVPVDVPADGILPLSAGGGQPRIRPAKQVLPTLDAWNLTVQHQLTNTMSLELAYIGNKGSHVFAGNGPAYDVNQVAYGTGTAIVGVQDASGTSVNFPAGTACNALPAGFSCVAPFVAATAQNNRRPFFNRFNTGGVLCCGPGTMGNYFGNDSSSNYNAFQVKLDKRFSQGLQFQANYTWSKSMNYSNDGGFLYSVAPETSYGPTDFNRDHVFIFNGTYELPFGRGKRFAGGASGALDAIIGGWMLTNTLNISSGLPFTGYASNCGSVVDTGPCVPDKTGSFAYGTGELVTPADGSPYIQYFTPVSSLAYNMSSLTVGTDTCSLTRPTSGPFAMTGCGRPGLIGRNSFRGPGGWKDDLSVTKTVRITERVSTQFRMEAFNVFNHPVYGFSANQSGGTCIDCGGDNGRIKDIENGTTMRQLQFALKLIF